MRKNRRPRAVLNRKIKATVTNAVELKAIEVCRMVVKQAEDGGNCGVCGRGDNDMLDPNDHEENCPYPKAKEVMLTKVEDM